MGGAQEYDHSWMEDETSISTDKVTAYFNPTLIKNSIIIGVCMYNV